MRKSLFIVLCLLSSIFVYSNDFVFKKLGINEGLSQISAHDIHQDHLNRIWIGTRDGLNCYDGNKIQVFRSVKGDSSTLISSEVIRINQIDNKLWLLSSTGVSCMDLNTMLCARYPLPITHELCVFNNNIVVSTVEGILEFNEKNNRFELFHNLNDSHTSYTSLFNNEDKELWIGTQNKGLLIFNNKTEEVTAFHSNKIHNIKVIKRDNRYNIWLGCEPDGLYLLNSNLEINEHFIADGTQNSLVNNSIRDITTDQYGNIWIGTYRGISIYNPNSKTFSTVTHSPFNPSSLSHNSVYSFLIDNAGGMWIGTYFGGANYTKIENQLYTYYNNDSPNKQPSYHVIGPFLEDEKNNLWIATEGGGLNYFDKKTSTFKYYQASTNKNSLSQNNVKALCLHNNSKLLIGTHMGGLNILDIASGKITNIPPGNDNSFSIISDIKQYKDEYIVTSHSGVYLFNIETNQFRPFFDENSKHNIGGNLFGILVDSKENIWLATEKNGLYKYTPKTDELKHYLSEEFDNTTIGSNKVLDIYEDHQFRVWIGTIGGGLSRYNAQEDNFETFTHQKHNIPSNFIYGISESRFGNLWISTRNGLSRFDVENNKFYNYDHTSGFPLSELNMNSLLLTSKGDLYVGGIDGMVSFNEADMIKRQHPTELLISELTVNNRQVKPLDHHNILKEDISVTQSIVLGPEQNVFKIDFSSCNYDPDLRHKYQYMLEGFDEQWIVANEKSYASYTNISPGDYQFKIRAIDAVYNDVLGTKTIAIIIEPPLYQTWYAYLIYITIFFSIIFIINYFYLSKVQLAYKLSQEQKEKSNQNELNQNKLRFFTNISHEFQTPLTLIIGSLELLKKTGSLPSKARTRIDLAYQNAARLKNLTTELLDFRKIDQGYLKLKVREVNFVEYLDTIYTSFSEIARARKIIYTYNKIENDIAIWCDPYQMDKVFYNILSNAFKFVSDKIGSISIDIINNPQNLEIYIKDNGNGIPKNEIEQVFNRFYQTENSAENQHTGSGIGLALSKGIIDVHGGKIRIESEIEEGTSFIISLQKGNKHFDPKQICEKSSNKEKYINQKINDLCTSIEEKKEAIELPDDSPTILVVDDNPNIINLIKEIFEEQYFILEAKDGEEAFNIALEKQPDLIISDVMMPILSGTEMCKKLKRNFLTSHIPVILLTARSAMEHKIEGIETGAEDYITKPFSTDYLMVRVENIFNNLQLLQQKYSQDLSVKTKHITKNKIDQEFLDKAIKIIEDNITDPEFSVTDFTAEMGQSRTLFYRKIKGVTGQTPNDLVQTIRLKKAAEMLLSDSTKNISEIAYDVGFSSPRYFSQCFRNHFGVIPSKYIIQSQEEDDSE